MIQIPEIEFCLQFYMLYLKKIYIYMYLNIRLIYECTIILVKRFSYTEKIFWLKMNESENTNHINQNSGNLD